MAFSAAEHDELVRRRPLSLPQGGYPDADTHRLGRIAGAIWLANGVDIYCASRLFDHASVTNTWGGSAGLAGGNLAAAMDALDLWGGVAQPATADEVRDDSKSRGSAEHCPVDGSRAGDRFH